MLRRTIFCFRDNHILHVCFKVPIMTTESVKRKVDLLDGEKEYEAKKIKIQDGSEPIALIDTTEKATVRRKLKKALVLMCYLGKNYYGMQKNHGVHTVEEDFLKALVKANIILPEEFDVPQSVKFQRAARTDKGVSAVRQIVSLKVPLKDISDSFPAKINEHLPPEIKVLCIKRVTQAFDAKIACDARTYSYMLPTFAFSDSEETDNEEFRISRDRIEAINEFLKIYLGTRNFYNFTSGRLATDASCKRYIMSIECGQPFKREGLEFVIIRIKGQSFMLHQIRKMVGLAIAVLRKLVPLSEIIEKIWETRRVDIPMAPGLGLMLEEVHYDWYNRKYGSDGVHSPLIWDDYKEIIHTFQDEQIHKNIAVTERDEKSMLQWLQTLPFHTFDIREHEPLVTSEQDDDSSSNNVPNTIENVS